MEALSRATSTSIVRLSSNFLRFLTSPVILATSVEPFGLLPPV